MQVLKRCNEQSHTIAPVAEQHTCNRMLSARIEATSSAPGQRVTCQHRRTHVIHAGELPARAAATARGAASGGMVKKMEMWESRGAAAEEGKGGEGGAGGGINKKGCRGGRRVGGGAATTVARRG